MATNSVREDGNLTPGPLVYRKGMVARLLGVHVRTIERLLSGNKFPRPDAHAGKCPLWKPSTVQAWLDKGGARI